MIKENRIIRHIRGEIPKKEMVLNSTGEANKGYREICPSFLSENNK